MFRLRTQIDSTPPDLCHKLQQHKTKYPTEFNLSGAFDIYFRPIFSDKVFKECKLCEYSYVRESEANKLEAKGLEVGQQRSTRFVYSTTFEDDYAYTTSTFAQREEWDCAVFNHDELAKLFGETDNFFLKQILLVMTGHAAKCIVIYPNPSWKVF